MLSIFFFYCINIFLSFFCIIFHDMLAGITKELILDRFDELLDLSYMKIL